MPQGIRADGLRYARGRRGRCRASSRASSEPASSAAGSPRLSRRASPENRTRDRSGSPSESSTSDACPLGAPSAVDWWSGTNSVPVSCQKPALSAVTSPATVSLIFSKNVCDSTLDATWRDICVSEFKPAVLRVAHLLDEASVAQGEGGQQPDLLEPFQLVGDEWAVASPAQDQHRADGVADGQWHDRRVMHHQEGCRELGAGGARLAEAPTEHDRPGRHGLIEERLPVQPGQRVLVSDEVGRSAALIARLDPKDILVEARQRAAIDVDVLGGKTHQAFHDLVGVAARHQVDLDRPGKIGRLGRAWTQVRAERARCQSRQALAAEECHARQGVAGT